MARFFKKRIENKGQAPGSLIFIGQQRADKVSMGLHQFNEEHYELKELDSVDQLSERSSGFYHWFNVIGLHDATVMNRIQESFRLHPLAMEDVMNTGQRAKFEEYDDHLFITLKMLQFDEEKRQVQTEQLSLLVGEDYLISFQEQAGDVFDAVRERLQNKKGRIRSSGPDYLAYALLDSVVDSYIYLIEHLGELIDDLELQVLDNPDKEVVNKINSFKRELHFVMKVVKPVRELTANMIRSQNSLIDRQSRPYFRDLEGLIIHALESVDTYRNLLSDYLNLYHSSLSTRMNDIMKVLTMFSAIFIPLSFFAGVYGTNFQYFPELEYRYSYFIFWGIIVVVAALMLWYFRRKRWL